MIKYHVLGPKPKWDTPEFRAEQERLRREAAKPDAPEPPHLVRCGRDWEGG